MSNSSCNYLAISNRNFVVSYFCNFACNVQKTHSNVFLWLPCNYSLFTIRIAMRLFYVVIQMFIELLFLLLFFQVLNFKMITFIYCREKGETGNAGEQPAGNTLYGYTAKEKVSAFFFCSFAGFLYG